MFSFCPQPFSNLISFSYYPFLVFISYYNVAFYYGLLTLNATYNGILSAFNLFLVLQSPNVPEHKNVVIQYHFTQHQGKVTKPKAENK